MDQVPLPTDRNGNPIPVHPAPNANYWGPGQPNVHVLTVGPDEPVVWQANELANLILIDTTEDVRVLIDGEAAVSVIGFPVRVGPPISFGIPDGGPVIAFQAIDSEAFVTITEA